MFRCWLEQEEAWQATKDQILKHWKSLKQQAVVPRPIPAHYKGSTYRHDSVRVTGTSAFINSILSRLKDFLSYESPSTTLDVSYEQITDKNELPVPGRYVAYIRVRQKDSASIV